MTFEIQKDEIGLNHIAYTKINGNGEPEKHYMCCANDEKLKGLYQFLDNYFNRTKIRSSNVGNRIIKHDFRRRIS